MNKVSKKCKDFKSLLFCYLNAENIRTDPTTPLIQFFRLGAKEKKKREMEEEERLKKEAEIRRQQQQVVVNNTGYPGKMIDADKLVVALQEIQERKKAEKKKKLKDIEKET